MLTQEELHFAKLGLLGLYEAAPIVGYRLRVATEYRIDLEYEAGYYKENWRQLLVFQGSDAQEQAWKYLDTCAMDLQKELPPKEFTQETDINWIDGDDGAMCLDCAIREYFGGSVQRFQKVNDGSDTSCKDVFGMTIDIHWDGRHFSYDERFPEGVYCEECGAEIEEPEEEYDEE